jgi:ketosteroid isomerase-like protein
MSQEENVERLRAWLETWGLDALARGEFDSSLVDPECVYEDRVLPDHAGETYRGYDGMAHAARVWLEPFEAFSIELERILPAGEHLVSLHRFRGTFRHTGIEFDVPLAWLYTFRDGIVMRWRAYPSEQEALEAAGLRE